MPNSLSKAAMGSPAQSLRLALGVLLLQERLGVTDRELGEQIADNPSLQCFLGLTAYQHEAPFHPSLLTTETMIQISFLVMNLEHLRCRGVFVWLSSWWQGWSFSGKALLVAQGNTMQADFRDRSVGVVECRGARMVRVAA